MDPTYVGGLILVAPSGLLLSLLTAACNLAEAPNDRQSFFHDPIGEVDRILLGKALNAWSTACSDVLGIEPSPALPALVVFDESRAWYIASRRSSVILPAGVYQPSGLCFEGTPLYEAGALHQGLIDLPGKQRATAKDLVGFTGFVEAPYASFVALALPSLWRTAFPELTEEELSGFFLGAFVHELTHSLHVADILPTIYRLVEHHPIEKPIADNSIVRHYAANPAFQQSLDLERYLFLQAAAQTNIHSRRSFTALAIAALRDRRRRHYVDSDAALSVVEDYYLWAEGLAMWTHYTLARISPDIVFLPENPVHDQVDTLRFLYEHPVEWVQEVGLSIYLLAEGLGVDWKTHALSGFFPPLRFFDDSLPDKGRLLRSNAR